MLNTAAPSYLPSWQTLINLPGAGCLWSRRQAAQVEASAVHLAWLKSAIPPNVGNSGVQFLVVGDCVRAIPRQMKDDRQPRFALSPCRREALYTDYWFSSCCQDERILKSNVSHHNCLRVKPLYRNTSLTWYIIILSKKPLSACMHAVIILVF